MVDITPEEWDREGWLALCEDHFDSFYDEEKDLFTDIKDEKLIYICDYEECDKEAVYELYPDLVETLERAKEEDSGEYKLLSEALNNKEK